MGTVNIAELKDQLSSFLQRVRAGEELSSAIESYPSPRSSRFVKIWTLKNLRWLHPGRWRFLNGNWIRSDSGRSVAWEEAARWQMQSTGQLPRTERTFPGLNAVKRRDGEARI